MSSSPFVCARLCIFMSLLCHVFLSPQVLSSLFTLLRAPAILFPSPSERVLSDIVCTCVPGLRFPHNVLRSCVV